LPNQPIHLVAEYKNTSQFSLNIYEVKSDYQGFLKYIYNSWNKDYFSQLKKTLVKKETFPLKNFKDYTSHKTSLEIAPLPSGIYVGEYLVDGNVQDHFYFIAANSRIIFKNKSDQQIFENELQLVLRNNGKILPKENLEFYEYVAQQNVEKSAGVTDAKAGFKIPENDKKRYYRYVLVRQSV
jgi:hypothetical protein